MRITVSGPPGSGTTTLSRAIAEKHGLKFVSAGDIFRAHVDESGMDILEFSKLCESDPSVDKAIDADQKRIGESSDNIILEGRLAGHMVSNADLKIWILASLDCRAARIAEREEKPYEKAFSETTTREKSEKDRYKSYYDIDIDDLSIYDLVINSEKWDKKELAEVVDFAISRIKN